VGLTKQEALEMLESDDLVGNRNGRAPVRLKKTTIPMPTRSSDSSISRASCLVSPQVFLVYVSYSF